MMRPLQSDEVAALQQGLHASAAFTVRRCQILLASHEGQRPRQIATRLSWSDQCVREAIHAFHREGLACLHLKSHATHTDQAAFDAAGLARLQDLLHQSPRAFGQPTSVWTLQGLAEVSYAQGLTPRQVSIETIRRALRKLGENWKRAKRWITSPDPLYAVKKGPGTA